mgnify:FL=1
MRGASYFSGKILDGILKLHFKKDWEKFLSENNGQEIEFFARLYKKQRTLNQNDYYWKLLDIISDSTGEATEALEAQIFTKEQLDRIYESLFSPKEVLKYRGKTIITSKHCRELSTKEFSPYLERVFAEAGELGIVLPDKDATHLLNL